MQQQIKADGERYLSHFTNILVSCHMYGVTHCKLLVRYVLVKTSNDHLHLHEVLLAITVCTKWRDSRAAQFVTPRDDRHDDMTNKLTVASVQDVHNGQTKPSPLVITDRLVAVKTVN